MVDDRAPALARRLTAHARVLRRGRIFARLREGWAYDEIAAQERLTAERVRQIVRKALEKRIIDEGAEHAKLQLARLQPAMRLAGEAIAEGDVTAIAPLMKVLDRLDRYQRAAKAVQVYDDEARKKLMDKINRVVANLAVDEPGRPRRRGGGARRRPSGVGRLQIYRARGPRKPLKRLVSDKEIEENPKAFLWRTAPRPRRNQQNQALFQILPDLRLAAPNFR